MEPSLGINFLAFRRSKVYPHWGPAEQASFSESVLGPEPPFPKLSRLAATTPETRFLLSLQFLFLEQIPPPPELMVFNPMGIVITYLQGDRAMVTERPR